MIAANAAAALMAGLLGFRFLIRITRLIGLALLVLAGIVRAARLLIGLALSVAPRLVLAGVRLRWIVAMLIVHRGSSPA